MGVGVAAAAGTWALLGRHDGLGARVRTEGAWGLLASRVMAGRAGPLVRRVVAQARASGVAAGCEREMPEFLDILGLGLSAGLSFDASLELYCSHHDTGLAREVRSAMRLWQMGVESRADALGAMSARVGSASLSRFCAAVSEALSFGAPLAETLEHQAGSIRDEQRLRTQERMEEVPVKMLVPLGTLVVPAMLLAILGPLVAAAMSK